MTTNNQHLSSDSKLLPHAVALYEIQKKLSISATDAVKFFNTFTSHFSQTECQDSAIAAEIAISNNCLELYLSVEDKENLK